MKCSTCWIDYHYFWQILWNKKTSKNFTELDQLIQEKKCRGVALDFISVLSVGLSTIHRGIRNIPMLLSA